MNFGIVAMYGGRSNEERVYNVVQCVNKAKEGLLVFPGWTLGAKSDIAKVEAQIEKGNKVTAVLDVEVTKTHKTELFLLQNGKITPMNSKQVLAQSSELNKTTGKKLLKELQEHRIIDVDGTKCLLLLCGESSIVRCHKESKPEIAIPSLAKEFESLFASVAAIINPMHTPWSNIYQWVIEERGKYFSKHDRLYIGVSNTKVDAKTLDGVRYLYNDGRKESIALVDELNAGASVSLYGTQQ